MTLTTLAIGLAWVLAGSALGQAVLTAMFVRALRRFHRPRLADAECPQAAVILCLRGNDPFLPDTIDAILHQDYPNYRLLVVVDRADDPAWLVVEEAIARSGATHATLRPLTERLETCSLKCSSLVQAVSSLDASTEIIAQLDADTVPHRTWLRELAAALSDDRVGAATGNRWYMPEQPTAGSIVRYLWNAAAVVQMYSLDVAWGGSLAVKVKVLRTAGLVEWWSRAFCEDTMLFGRLREHGYRVQFVPSLMMVNREVCDVPEFHHWMRRQLMTARLYHPRWPAALTAGLVAAVVPLAAALVCLLAVVRHDVPAAVWAGGALLAYEIALVPMLFSIEAAVRRIVSERAGQTRWLSAGIVSRILALIPVSQAVSLSAIVSATRLRDVEWRGVSYRVDGPWSVRPRADRSTDAPPKSRAASTSL